MPQTQKTVAVIGASNDRRKFGNKALRAFGHRGFLVVPINPNETVVEGIAYASVLAFPDVIDMATVYVPPSIGEALMAEIAEKGIAEVWLNPGADGPGVIARARALALEPRLGCSITAIGEHPSAY